VEVQRNSAHIARRPVYAGRVPGCCAAMPFRGTATVRHMACCRSMRAWMKGNCFKCSKMRKDVPLDICPARWHACTVAGVHPSAVF
jgi:hypothetical protein